MCVPYPAGKTWSIQQVYYYLAKECSLPGCNLVPLLVPIQKLARFLVSNPDGLTLNNQASEQVIVERQSHTSTPDLLLRFIMHEFAGQREQQMMLQQAYELRTLVLLLDGVDEAAGMREDIESFVLHQLLPAGLRIVVTSRPEGVRLRLYVSSFVVMNLLPLTDEQQIEVIDKQTTEDGFFSRLFKLSDVRKKHDSIYRDKLLSKESYRNKIESISLSQYKSLNQDIHARIKDMSRFVGINEDEPQSVYLRDLNKYMDCAGVLDQIDDTISNKNNNFKSDTEHTIAKKIAKKAAENLVKYVIQLRDLDEPEATARSVWPRIVAHTDKIYVVAEQMLPVFEQASKDLVVRLGLNPNVLEFGGLKDPIRITEKANTKVSVHINSE